MASSTGSFPAFLRRHLRPALLALGWLLVTTAAPAAVPDYVREALEKFNSEVPKGWAYTLTTVRNDQDSSTARFDPSKPPAEQWTLLALNGRPPTEKEMTQFARTRAGSGNSSGLQASFQKADIQPASIELIREDAVRGEFRAQFREEATGADKMLGHLTLRLTVRKQQPQVERFTLELKEPYSPILGVKMSELLVKMSFSDPTPERPALPVDSSSHFLGRIFFIGMEENLRLTYSDFVRVD